ncbi:hypothetical protein KIPE111705_11320 [Kibdelosporangium persicum]|uniref:TIR domain-containing protein n=1 Tax=Kibdelosporangium persicum TaxID=2698649 RepID=A0ABX2EWS4_9PSEU|nr:hypothetical protein [Kibdelosporangium persicum]NRN63438.1 hypothetical protein [Kibdelosporangium persicum]
MTDGDGGDNGVLWPLVRALMRVGCLNDLSGRNLVIRIVSDELDHPLAVDEYPQTTTHLFSLVNACRQRSDGLPTLLKVLERLEPGSTAMADVKRVITDMIVYDTISPEDRRQLFTLLSGVVIPEIGDLYRLVAGEAALDLPDQTTYQEMFRVLETLNASVDGVPKAIVFVEHLAGRVRLDLAVELRRWVSGQAGKLGLEQELAKLREQLATTLVPKVPQRSDGYVVFQIERAGPSGDAYRMATWKQLDVSDGWHPERGQDVHASNLSEMKFRVAEVIETVESEWAQFEPNIRLEFLLSTELLNLDVDQWQWETESRFPEPMGCRFPVSVRSLERMKARKWHRAWYIRWKELRTQVEENGGVAKGGGYQNPSNAHQALRELVSHFERTPSIVSLILSAPPTGATYADEISIALRAGIPVILWHRSDCDTEEFAAAVDNILYETNPLHLLDRVRMVRANAYSDGLGPRHVGSQLTILWDDPYRMVIPEGVPAA